MWWREGLYFSCIGCGRCCRGEPGAIYFTEDEGAAIAAFLNVTPEEFESRYVTGKWRAPSLKEKYGGDCIFHDEKTNLCRIYEVRPLQCRLFPFWPSLMAFRVAWDAAARECPGMNSGEFHSAEEIKRLLALCPFPELL